MIDLLDMMKPDPKPVWRDGQPMPRPADKIEGDLLFLWNDYRDARQGGKWFRFDARDCIWRCLDPFNQTGINNTPDQPPPVDKHGRMPSEAEA